MQNNINTEKILDSLQGMKRAEAPPFLFTRIQAQLDKKINLAGKKVPVKWVTLSFAGLALLCMINFFALSRTAKADNSPSEETSAENYLTTENGFYY
ncbi:MAG: hypothetical protein ACOZCO_18280 [Bacteroidota bacterium]